MSMEFDRAIPEVPNSEAFSPIKPFDMTPSPDTMAKEMKMGFDFNLEMALRPSQTNAQLNPSKNSPRRSPHTRHRGNMHHLDDIKGKNYVMKSYASEKNYQNLEQEKMFAGIDPHFCILRLNSLIGALKIYHPHLEDPAQMDSFLNFLRTNNMLDYSVSGLFDEQGDGSSRNLPKTNRSSKRILTDQLSDNFLGENYIPEPMTSNMDVRREEEQPVDHITFSRSSGKKLPDNSSISLGPPVGLSDPRLNLTSKQPESAQVLNKFKNFRLVNFSQLQDESVAKAIQSEIPKRQISYQPADQSSQPAFGYRYVQSHTELIGNYSGYMKVDKKHGPGTMLFKDGGKYEGDWNENSMSGIGKLTYPDDTVGYEGGFFQNKPYGHGKLINSELAPQFSNEKFQRDKVKTMHSRSQAHPFSAAILIETHNSASKTKESPHQTSPGKSVSLNSESLRTQQTVSDSSPKQLTVDYTNLGKLDHIWTHFEGIFVAGSKEGPGKLTFATGEEFVGHFQNDKANGSGFFKTAKNETIFGIWQDNQLQTILCRK